MDFPYVVKHKKITIKLYDWMDYPKEQSVRNVEAFDKDGNSLWIIEAFGGHPPTDCYTNISSKFGKIHAFNFQGYDCIIDQSNGKILKRVFTK